MVVYGKIITARQAGSRLASVSCEKCRQPFAYVLTRVGVGKGSAVYGIGQQGATHRAAGSAERDLHARLSVDMEMVPCPACHWVNAAAIEQYRTRKYRGATALIVVLLVGTFVALAMVPAFLTGTYGYQSRAPAVARGLILVVGAASAAFVLLVRRQMRRRLDPNRTFPRWPTVPPGTPPALVEQRDAATGRTVLVPAPRPATPDDGGGGILLRPGQLDLPPVCCLCLAPATMLYLPAMATSHHGDSVAVPMCQPCRRRLRWRWWGAALVTAVVSIAGVGGLVFALPGGDAAGHWALFGAVGSVTALIASLVVAGVAVRPYRLQVIDRDRGISRFVPRSPAFAALVADRVRAADAAAIPLD